MISAHHTDFFILRPLLQEKASALKRIAAIARPGGNGLPRSRAAGSTPTDPMLAAHRSSSPGTSDDVDRAAV
jgi:predicted butyrate kinase (DUF1464 family)